MADLTYNDYLARLSVQDVLKDAGYVYNRRDGKRYPSYVRLDEHGRRIRGDKFIVTQDGRCCFQPPIQKTYNVISLIKEHPDFFPEYSAGMNLDLLVNKVCCRLLNTFHEGKEREIREPMRETKPFDMDSYDITRLDGYDPESRKPFYPFFKHRAIDLKTQYAFKDSFVLASKESDDRKGVIYKNLSFPLTIPGGDGKIVGFEERGRPHRDGSASYKGKAAGSNAATGLWIASPAKTSLKDTDKIYLFESAYDAMSYFQLHSSEDPGIREAVFISSGGTPTRGQMEGLIRTAPKALFHLCFDNDEAGKQFAENFKSIVKTEKPYSEAAIIFKATPGNIELDEAKAEAFDKLPEDIRRKYYDTYAKHEEVETAFLCPEDKEALREEVVQGYKDFSRMVDDCIIRVERVLPSEGYKDFNEELIAANSLDDRNIKKAVGSDLDGDGQLETEESNEEKHKYHR